MGDFVFPTLEDRITINGRTGTGKSVAGAWLLSNAAFHKQPFVIIDFKFDKLLTQINRAKPIGLHEKLPDAPGVYIAHPDPEDEDGIEDFMRRVWRKTGIGLYLDEGMLINQRSRAFRRILVTGRSLHIPVYTLSQRPCEVCRRVFSEANHYVAFNLNDKRDEETVANFTPTDRPDWDMKTKLKPYHFRWYHIDRDWSARLKPVPHPDAILEKFDERLRPKRKWL